MPDRSCFRAAALLLGLATTDVPARAGDWPWWRGPERTGISAETDFGLKAHADTSWSASVGLGYSCVSVSAGRLYTLGYDTEAGEDVVTCLDAGDGTPVWTYRYPAQRWDKSHEGGTLTTPSVDGDRVFVSNREGRLMCLGAADGKVLWSKHLDQEYDLDLPRWGFAASPVVLPGCIVMSVGNVLAFDKETGKLLWKSRDGYGDAYATPALLEVEGEPSLAAFAGKGLTLLRCRDGGEEASFPWKTQYDINAATPVICGERIFISSGYNHGCAMLRLAQGRLVSVWDSKVMRNQMAGCIFHEDHLYGFDDATFKCIDLDGKEQWVVRDLGKGAHTLAGDRLILLSEQGDLVFARATPERYDELARARVLEDGGKCWTPPVVAHGRIYCRSSRGTLVCRDHRLETGGEPPGR